MQVANLTLPHVSVGRVCKTGIYCGGIELYSRHAVTYASSIDAKQPPRFAIWTADGEETEIKARKRFFLGMACTSGFVSHVVLRELG